MQVTNLKAIEAGIRMYRITEFAVKQSTSNLTTLLYNPSNLKKNQNSIDGVVQVNSLMD